MRCVVLDGPVTLFEHLLQDHLNTLGRLRGLRPSCSCVAVCVDRCLQAQPGRIGIVSRGHSFEVVGVPGALSVSADEVGDQVGVIGQLGGGGEELSTRSRALLASAGLLSRGASSGAFITASCPELSATTSWPVEMTSHVR
jgi:hypothetical protein